MPLFVNQMREMDAAAVKVRVESQFQPPLAGQQGIAVLNLLQTWIADGPNPRRFRDDGNLVLALASELKIGLGQRENYFYQQTGENTNIHSVIHESVAQYDSVGWTQAGFFQNLGHERHTPGSPQRNAEQEYLMQGMVKGAMSEAVEIAHKFGVGIAVRPTGVLAHPGIESGDPTKAQEFKNKTSKEEDLFLCDELNWQDLGAVVHYDPRVGWMSAVAERTEPRRDLPKQATDLEWINKRAHITQNRLPALAPFKNRLKFWPNSEADWQKLQALFKSRATEYAEEDFDYRDVQGHYHVHVILAGPMIRLRMRPDANMVGDHDLFGFTLGGYGLLFEDRTLGSVQVALQEANTFQAQHGGIWNWRPHEVFHQAIKDKIMSAHSPPNGEPLLYFLPDYRVHAVFYIPGQELLKSAWEYPQATKWLESTYSGKKLLS